MTSISILDLVYFNNMGSLKVALSFFAENKFYDRKGSSLTKYYCIRTKFFKKLLRSPLSMNG